MRYIIVAGVLTMVVLLSACDGDSQTTIGEGFTDCSITKTTGDDGSTVTINNCDFSDNSDNSVTNLPAEEEE